ncbi:DNA gyrase subunit A [Gloeobacter kilaueensis]|uniref:DNA gyrase subunit A n=1 Tax=Gloeobacter kilaueensis (strain ATCC BAA-2537 / CCAP 1431/1 / ULC 316 / JS1) TaxID=1183438 RepID=U5QQI5_GLOK1|nr:DNA gyrase subunit A [Gloeobacter kilaueensis]AGY59874.1 DNA gyrase subunit A [Gloeobacter kilaueensis JS1]
MTIIPTNLRNEMQRSYLEYAMSVIVGRALPDVRDGLKPVHRRILFGMHELGMSPDRPYRKCARVVGDVLGKYHPHGDTAVYDALVRLAQDFSTRYLLIDGHGNFGSVDNDPPAAMRYTECRLTALARDTLLADLEAETVDFIDNFDGSQQEPIVLPARLPQLLLNGSAGIAVGMATNIPPHNLGELVDGLGALIANPDLSVLELTRYVTGPDFPTGGTILGQSGIREAYTTGRGSITMRGVANIETIQLRGRPEREAIVITELPYQVCKAALIEKIAELVNDKRIDGISDIRDESDRDGLRVVIELKRDAYPRVVLNNLYKLTPLQTNFGCNMLALVDGEPRLLDLKEFLQTFLDFRIEVITRRTRFELRKAQERDHLLQGQLIALANLEEVIALIRAADDTATARLQLVERFALSETQAEAILQLQLRRLTGLEASRIEAEHQELLIKIADLTDVLNRRERINEIIRTELTQARQRFGDTRRTVIVKADGEIDDADLIANQEMVVLLTQQGYIKRLPVDTFDRQRRATRGKSGARMREDDVVDYFITCCNHDTVLFFTNRGVVYGLRGYQIPAGSRTAKGTPIVQLLPIPIEEKVTSIVPVQDFASDDYLVMLTRAGYIKKTALAAFANLRANGLIAIGLEEGDELRWVRRARAQDDILVGSRAGMAIRFRADEDQLRALGRTARGVKSMELRKNDELVSMDILSCEQRERAEANGDCGPWVLVVTAGGFGKRVPFSEFRAQNRGGMGVIATKFRDEGDELAALRVVGCEEELMIVTARGVIIRQHGDEISQQSRAATGVRVQRLDEDDTIVGVAVVPESEESTAIACAPEEEAEEE